VSTIEAPTEVSIDAFGINYIRTEGYFFTERKLQQHYRLLLLYFKLALARI